MFGKELVEKHIRPLEPVPTDIPPSGSLRHPVRCLMFDIYGTLFASDAGDISLAREDHPGTQALADLLARHSIEKEPAALLAEFYAAVKADHDRSRKTGIDHPEVDIIQIWSTVLGTTDLEKVRAFALETEMIINPVYPMPRLKEFLGKCKDSGLLMGIVSNAQFYTPYLFHWFLEADLDTLGFAPDLIFYSYQYGRGKPSTFLYELAADQLGSRGIEPEAVLYVGNDMGKDILPSAAVGFQTALFAGDRRSLRLRKEDPEVRQCSPDIVITELEQILDHLEQ